MNCLNMNSNGAANCFYCENSLDASGPRSFIGRIKNTLGIISSSDIITLSLEEPERFFSSDEIDSLIDLEQAKPLKTTDVPNWEIMFFSSKRIRKPVK